MVLLVFGYGLVLDFPFLFPSEGSCSFGYVFGVYDVEFYDLVVFGY
jgi:hypothetical protein